MAPQVAAALISAAPALFQGITGFIQNKQGRVLQKELERPVRPIPPAALEAVERAKNLSTSFYMPGQQQAQQQIDQNFSNTAQTIQQSATSGPEALAAILAASGQQMGAQNALAGQAEQSYMNRQAAVTNQLQGLASWQDTAWQWNEMKKFQEEAAAASALKEAGKTNLFGALNTGAGIAANFLAGGIGKSIGGGGTANVGGMGSLLNKAATSNPSMVPASKVNLSQGAASFLKSLTNGNESYVYPQLFFN